MKKLPAVSIGYPSPCNLFNIQWNDILFLVKNIDLFDNSYFIMLLQWALMTILDPPRSLANLIYIGYGGDPATALRVTRRRLTDRKKQKTERNVFHCFVFGPKKAGKSALLNTLIRRCHSFADLILVMISLISLPHQLYWTTFYNIFSITIFKLLFTFSFLNSVLVLTYSAANSYYRPFSKNYSSTTEDNYVMNMLESAQVTKDWSDILLCSYSLILTQKEKKKADLHIYKFHSWNKHWVQCLHDIKILHLYLLSYSF